MKIRYPSVAGTFYPAEAGRLKDLIRMSESGVENRRAPDLSKIKIIGGVVPHAGYIYCGREAVSFFKILAGSKQRPQTFVILHPDHYGVGRGVYTDGHDLWETPLGEVEVDRELGDEIKLMTLAERGGREHAAEVMLPFLQYYLPYRFRILPVGMHDQGIEASKVLSEALFAAQKSLSREIVIIASSDFSHYVPPQVGEQLDELAMDRIRDLDSAGLYRTVVENNITICGYGPIMTLLFYARCVARFPQVEILAKGNSGKAGSDELVVDYASILVYA